jgi:cation transport ATPase
MSTVTGKGVAAAPDVAIRSAKLAIRGMTCASCAVRVERRLNKLKGVTATVNFATETAQVNFPAAVSTGDLTSAVEQADYIAALTARPETVSAATAEEDDGAREAAALRQQLLVSLALAIPVVVLADPEPDRPDHSLQEHHAAVQPTSLSSSARRDSPAITRNLPGSHRWRACPAIPPGAR